MDLLKQFKPDQKNENFKQITKRISRTLEQILFLSDPDTRSERELKYKEELIDDERIEHDELEPIDFVKFNPVESAKTDFDYIKRILDIKQQYLLANLLNESRIQYEIMKGKIAQNARNTNSLAGEPANLVSDSTETPNQTEDNKKSNFSLPPILFKEITFSIAQNNSNTIIKDKFDLEHNFQDLYLENLVRLIRQNIPSKKNLSWYEGGAVAVLDRANRNILNYLPLVLVCTLIIPTFLPKNATVTYKYDTSDPKLSSKDIEIRAKLHKEFSEYIAINQIKNVELAYGSVKNSISIKIPADQIAVIDKIANYAIEKKYTVTSNTFSNDPKDEINTFLNISPTVD